MLSTLLVVNEPVAGAETSSLETFWLEILHAVQVLYAFDQRQLPMSLVMPLAAATAASGPGHLSLLTVLLAAVYDNMAHTVAVRDRNRASDC
jgi:hypothetical protein